MPGNLALYPLMISAASVWPIPSRRARAEGVVPTEAGWRAISDYVREQLFASLSLQLDEASVAPEERAEAMRGMGAMIEAGTEPVPGNFSEFEPIPGDAGRLAGLRFVFPPYQVGPYSAGTQAVEVPAAVLLPYVDPPFRGLFDGAG